MLNIKIFMYFKFIWIACALSQSNICSASSINEKPIGLVENVKSVPKHSFPIFNEQNQKYLQEGRELIRDKTLSLQGVILFAGADWYGKAVETYLHDDYSHMGLVLKASDNQELCFESTGNLAELIRQRILPQVRIHKLQDVVDQYNGKAVRRDFAFSSDQDKKKVKDFVNQHLGVLYEEHFIDIFKSASRSNVADDTSLFCSELVALMLQELGYLSKEFPADDYTPRDFSEKFECFKLIGATLGKEFKTSKTSKTEKSFCVIL